LGEVGFCHVVGAIFCERGFVGAEVLLLLLLLSIDSTAVEILARVEK
jgi:hypothetical protein